MDARLTARLSSLVQTCPRWHSKRWQRRQSPHAQHEGHGSGRHRALLGTVCLLALLGWLTPAFATIYYVDPNATNASNSNAGTATSPWQNPPGTLAPSSSNCSTSCIFSSQTWGAITQSSPIQCGDTILLKGGSTQTSTQGGAWLIDSHYYSSKCQNTPNTSNPPITIRVASPADWDATSTGNFTLDGTHVTAVCVSFCNDTYGLVLIQDINNLVFGGNSVTQQRLVIQHAAITSYKAHNLLLTSSNYTPPPTQFEGQWLELAFAQNDGVGVGFAQNFVIHDTISHDNGWSGFSTGLLNDDAVFNGAFQDVEAYNNGANGGSGTGDQFLFTGCASCYLIRANSHDAQRRGLNFGNIHTNFLGTNANMFLLIRDSQFTHNGLTTNKSTNDPSNTRLFVYKSGPCWSGDDTTGAPYQFGVMERSIIRYNREAGGPCAYGQGWASVWNSVWWDNGWDTKLYGPADIAVADAVDVNYFGVFNSIVQKRSAITWTHKAPSGFGHQQCPVSDYNLFVPSSGDTDALADFQCGSMQSYSTSTLTYAYAEQHLSDGKTFLGPHTRVGSSWTVKFASPSDTGSTNGFQLLSGSSAMDAGTFMFSAVSGSPCSMTSSSCTISVVGNPQYIVWGGQNVLQDPTGGSNDPTHYFLSPSSYYHATGDTIQIQGCGLGTITSMTQPSSSTPGTMTFTPLSSAWNCTAWQAGAGLHFPWGALTLTALTDLTTRPDMGVCESDSSYASPLCSCSSSLCQ